MTTKDTNKTDEASSANSEENKRRENGRFELRAHATLTNGNGNWPAHLINLSAEGALIAITDKHNIHENDDIELRVELEEQQFLDLHGQVAHTKDHYLGIKCSPPSEADSAALAALIERFREGEHIPVSYS